MLQEVGRQNFIANCQICEGFSPPKVSALLYLLFTQSFDDTFAVWLDAHKITNNEFDMVGKKANLGEDEKFNQVCLP